MVGWGGGIPVKVNDVVVGAVSVSGLSQKEDMELAQIGTDAILAISPPRTMKASRRLKHSRRHP